MVDKIAALVSERDKALRSHDRELATEINAKLAKLADRATTPAQRAAKRIVDTGKR